MESIPNDVSVAILNVFTLIGENLIDDRFENREEFEKVQVELFQIVNKYNLARKKFSDSSD